MGEEKVIAAFFYVVAVGSAVLALLNVTFYFTEQHRTAPWMRAGYLWAVGIFAAIAIACWIIGRRYGRR
jgi:hypothetical protein